MKLVFIIVLFSIHLRVISMLSCKPFKKTPLVNLVAESSIVVKVKAGRFKGRGKIHNATAEITQVFQTRTGDLKVKSKVSFGLVGKNKNCTRLKPKREYILFLNNADQDGFHAISFNPVKASAKTVRALKKKYLCPNCLKPASFKKSFRTLKKPEGKKLKIRCKASGLPKPTIKWYYNDKLLTKSNTPEEFVIKNRKKGGSGTIEIKEVERKHDKAKVVCSAVNALTPTPVNFTIEIKVTDLLSGEKCKKSCSKKLAASYCIKGQCCQDTPDSLRCRCIQGYHGVRCENKHIATIRTNSLQQMSLRYRHMQRMVAVLGMCLALMFVVFLCFSVYCLFKRRRTRMIYDVLKKKSSSTTRLKDEDHNSGSSSTSSPTQSPRSQVEETSPINRTRSNQSANGAKNASMYSVEGGGSRRNRLNGFSHRSPASRMCASREDSPVHIRTTANLTQVENVLHVYPEVSTSSPVPHQANPLFQHPSNSHNQLGIEESLNKQQYQSTSVSSLPDQTTAVVKLQVDHSAETNCEKMDGLTSPSLVSSDPTFHHQFSSSPSRVLNLSRSVDSSVKQLPNSSNQGRSTSSENEDFFRDMEIPDTSLGLQSLQRPLRHQASFDYEEPHYATPVMRREKDAVVLSSMRVQQQPLLSKQNGGRDSSSLVDESSSDESDSPRIEV